MGSSHRWTDGSEELPGRTAAAFARAEHGSAPGTSRSYGRSVSDVGWAPGERAPARGLLLDIGGVVLAAGPVLVNRLAEREPALARVVEPFGGLAGPADDLWRRMLVREVSEREYWAVRGTEVAQALGLDVARGGTRALMELLYAGPAHEWLREETLDLMDEVKRAGLPLGALTNDMADFHGEEWVREQRWLDLFDVVVDASKTGVLKPDPRAYAAGVAALGLAPHEIVYLDDMPWNVDGGLAAGLQAVRMPHGDAGDALADVRFRLGLVTRSGTPDPSPAVP